MKLATKRDPIAHMLGLTELGEEPPLPLLARKCGPRGTRIDWNASRAELAAYVEYHNGQRGRSLRDISNDFSVPPSSFTYAIRKLDIKYRATECTKPRYTPAQKAKMLARVIEMRQLGEPYPVIAKALGTGSDTPARWMRELEAQKEGAAP